MQGLPEIKVVIALITDASGNYLLSLRKPNQDLAGCWEFPGGKIDPGETEEQALYRECNEELGIKVTQQDFVYSFIYQYPEKNINFFVYRVSEFSGRAHGREQQEIRWYSSDEIAKLQLPPANQYILDKLER